MKVVDMIRRIIDGESERDARDTIREDAAKDALAAHEDVASARRLRELIVAEHQYSLRLIGRGRR